MESVNINRECCIAYTVLAVHTLYHSSNKEIKITELTDEIKTMTELYTDDIELLKKSKEILEKEGKNKITFCDQKIGINIAECAKYLGISNQLMSEIVREPDFPCIKFKRRFLINKSKVQEWFDNNIGKRIKY